MKPQSPSMQRLLRVVMIIAITVAAIAAAVWLYRLVSTPAESPKKRAVQEIALLKPPPPPPPPKTPPPPPPPKPLEQKIDVPKPDPTPQPSQAPPPGPDLGVDAAGTGTGDGFGLVGRPGGVDLIGSGGGGGGAANRFAWYGALVQERIREAVLKDPKLRESRDYQRVVHVWVNGSGNVTRFELVGAGPNPELDDALRNALRTLPPVREGAPTDMPQPIRLRVTARS